MALTFALGTAAPVWSVTIPEMVARKSCAKAQSAVRSNVLRIRMVTRFGNIKSDWCDDVNCGRCSLDGRRRSLFLGESDGMRIEMTQWRFPEVTLRHAKTAAKAVLGNRNTSLAAAGIL